MRILRATAGWREGEAEGSGLSDAAAGVNCGEAKDANESLGIEEVEGANVNTGLEEGGGETEGAGAILIQPSNLHKSSFATTSSNNGFSLRHAEFSYFPKVLQTNQPLNDITLYGTTSVCQSIINKPTLSV